MERTYVDLASQPSRGIEALEGTEVPDQLIRDGALIEIDADAVIDKR